MPIKAIISHTTFMSNGLERTVLWPVLDILITMWVFRTHSCTMPKELFYIVVPNLPFRLQLLEYLENKSRLSTNLLDKSGNDFVYHPQYLTISVFYRFLCLSLYNDVLIGIQRTAIGRGWEVKLPPPRICIFHINV